MDIIMAAPSTAYTGSHVKTQNNGQMVNNALAVPTEEKSILLNRFFLDELIIVKDGNGVEGFNGFVRIGSFNERMHNANRVGSLRKFVSGVCYNFTDAGLNTLGICYLGIPYSEFGEGIKVSISFRTAFYVATDGLKLRYRINGGTWYEYFVSGSLASNDEGTFVAGINDAGGIEPNAIVEVQALNVNAEGTYSSNITSFQVPKPSTIMGYGSYASNAYQNFASNYSRITMFFSTFGLEVGTEVYTNPSSTINGSAGFYANDSFWIKTEMQGTFDQKCVIVASGSIGNWGSDDPATPATTYPITFLGTAILGSSGGRTWQQVCSNPAYLQPYNCHLVVATQRYVTSASPLGEPISNAIYYISETEFVVIQNGYKTNDGNCTQGIIFSEIEE